MTDPVTDRQEVLARLRAALGAGRIPPRAAEGCGRLLDRLDRPVRVVLAGPDRAGREALLRAILGAACLPPGSGWPTLDVVPGTRARYRATLADASVLAAEGRPGADILAQGPVFLQITVPVPALARMSLLHLAVGANAAAQAAALAWAARRSDVTVWCTSRFGQDEAQVWAGAPEALKAHALMAVLGATPEAADSLRRPREFGAVVAVPMPGGRPDTAALLARLAAEIDTARAEDIDAARMILHRFSVADVAPGPVAAAPGQAPVPPGDAGSAQRAVTPEPATPTRPLAPVADAPGPDRGAILSEPILYLQRRARALHETLAWPDPDADRAAEVLAACCETAESLRDRAADWTDEDPALADLAALAAEAADTALLLQVEGGPDRAEDAAALILQLRLALEAQLPAARPAATTLRIAC